MSDAPNGRSTLPAPHPDTPEWAVQHFNTMVGIYQEWVEARRRDDARMSALEAEQKSLELRVSRIESEYRGDEVTQPGE
jgi:hypothetical protein